MTSRPDPIAFQEESATKDSSLAPVSDTLRRDFLDFFAQHAHAIEPSSSVSPQGDPTLLFTNAGMNQFKPYFLGESRPKSSKVVSSQKCVRVGGKHNDLENVGHTSRHLTFFEMLGNFSFGSYFKEEAIALAFACTKEVFGFPLERLYVSVYEEDQEAYDLWCRIMPKERIVKMGAADNFWSMGSTGPCGPCSELYFDLLGEEKATAQSKRSPLEDPEGERFLEFWNLVFMEKNRDAKGTVENLPSKNIDTGAGLERLVALKMGVSNIFEIDSLSYLVKQVFALSEIGDQKNASLEQIVAARVIADHLRMLCFSIHDGVLPSNLEQGYILRKVARRALRYGKSALGLEEPFLTRLVPHIVRVMAGGYDLSGSCSHIEEVLLKEEESFGRTLKRGGKLLWEVCHKAKSEGRAILGEEAFRLKDTYGMPFDEIALLAKDHHLGIDHEGFIALEQEAKERSKSDPGKEPSIDQELRSKLLSLPPTTFVGYNTSSCSARLLAIIEQGELHKQRALACNDWTQEIAHGKSTSDSKEHDRLYLLFDQSPLYVEQGGQVSDQGLFTFASPIGTVHLRLEGALKVKAQGSEGCYDLFGVLHAQVEETEPQGEPQQEQTLLATTPRRVEQTIAIHCGLEGQLAFDPQERKATSQHHSATHLLHWALRNHLGPHVIQKGSYVDAHSLRFDFSHHKPLSQKELFEVEQSVSGLIARCERVETKEIPYAEARKDPSIVQAFGDRYGASVRVVSIGPSKELCGGTHVTSSGEIGPFMIVKESSIAAGIRRVEAVTGLGALARIQKLQQERKELASSLKCSEEQMGQKVLDLQSELASLKKEKEHWTKEQLLQVAQQALQGCKKVGAFDVIVYHTTLDGKQLQLLGSMLKGKADLIALFNREEQQAQILMLSSHEQLHAGILIGQIAPLIAGRGGGKPQMAQAGGKDPSKLEQAQAKLLELVPNS